MSAQEAGPAQECEPDADLTALEESLQNQLRGTFRKLRDRSASLRDWESRLQLKEEQLDEALLRQQLQEKDREAQRQQALKGSATQVSEKESRLQELAREEEALRRRLLEGRQEEAALQRRLAEGQQKEEALRRRVEERDRAFSECTMALENQQQCLKGAEATRKSLETVNQERQQELSQVLRTIEGYQADFQRQREELSALLLRLEGVDSSVRLRGREEKVRPSHSRTLGPGPTQRRVLKARGQTKAPERLEAARGEKRKQPYPWERPSMVKAAACSPPEEEAIPRHKAFRGIQHNVSLSEMVQKGWTEVLCASYAHKTTSKDFELAEEFRGGSLLLAARKTGSDTLALAAMGNYDKVTLPTQGNATTEHNGVFWYFSEGRSVGFSPTSEVKLNWPDVCDHQSQDRLSWQLTGNHGGYRAGAAVGLYGSSGWEKVLLASTRKVRYE